MATQSEYVGANGFCTMTGTRSAAHKVTRRRCEGMVVTISTKSGRVARNISAASVNQRRALNRSAAETRLGLIEVADCRDLNAIKVRPGVQMVGRKIAAADHRDA